MALRHPIPLAIKRSLLSTLAPWHSLQSVTIPPYATISISQRRSAHSRRAPPPPPPPTPFVPDVTTFLTLIGRSLSQHASKFPSWEALFNTTSPQLKELGIEPPRARRYLLRWRDKFRYGEWGVGGDLAHVEDGVGLVGVVELRADRVAGAENAENAESTASTGPEEPKDLRGVATMTKTPGVRRIIVSVPPGTEPLPSPEALSSLKRVQHMKIKGIGQIAGPYAEPVKGSRGMLAKIRVQEGLWEHKRGEKLDGGERRRADVRAKRRAAERKAAG